MIKRELIRDVYITSYQVVEAYVKRIKEVNPYVNAVVDNRFEAALIEAKDCDEQLRVGKHDLETLEKEKPLYGVPITVKECCAVKGLSYTGGVVARKGVKAIADAVVVELFRKRGVILLCVTNIPEMCCNFESSNWLYGRTYNPYDSRYTSGGSSGGESALLGAGASVIGICSDLCGSVRIPALFSGVFGHKTTVGIVPSDGLLPYSDDEAFKKLLCCGSMTRYAEDLDISIKIMTAMCNCDLRLDIPVDLKRLRVYYRENVDKGFAILSTDPELEKCVRDVANHFTQRGIRAEKLPVEWPSTIVEITITMLTSIKKMPQLLVDINNPELRKNPIIELGKALIGRSYHTVSVILNELQWQKRMFFSDSKISYYLQYGDELRKKLLDLLGEDGVFICPTFRTPAMLPCLTLFEVLSSSYSGVINYFGFPATHIPIGLSRDGLPIGVQVIAAPYQDRLCLAVAKELEKAFGGWIPPTTSIGSYNKYMSDFSGKPRREKHVEAYPEKSFEQLRNIGTLSDAFAFGLVK